MTLSQIGLSEQILQGYVLAVAGWQLRSLGTKKYQRRDDTASIVPQLGTITI